jgi:HAD superfamily hydrolase (TIGR01509 family)
MAFDDRFDAVIFDMDGTMLDSMSHWRRINYDFLERRGLQPPADIRENLMFIHNKQAIARYIQEFHLPLSPEEILEEYRAIMRGYYLGAVLPKPYLFTYLSHLKRRGKRMCVGTATPAAIARPALERHGILEHMEFILSARDEDIGKGDPAFYRLAAGKLGLSPARCALFDDAPYAMRGAKTAGLTVLAMAEPIQAPLKEEILSLCDLYVHDFGQLCV